MDDKVLINRHTYHPPAKDQIPRFEELRAMALEFSLLINRSCPDSDEKTIALGAIDVAVFNANASIARHEHE